MSGVIIFFGCLQAIRFESGRAAIIFELDLSTLQLDLDLHTSHHVYESALHSVRAKARIVSILFRNVFNFFEIGVSVLQMALFLLLFIKDLAGGNCSVLLCVLGVDKSNRMVDDASMS